MIRKFVTGSVISAVMFLASAATAGPYDPDDECLLHMGCTWNGTTWVCADPGIYAYCLSQGG